MFIRLVEFSGKRDNENLNDFPCGCSRSLRHEHCLPSLRLRRGKGRGSPGEDPEVRSRLLTKGRLHPLLPFLENYNRATYRDMVRSFLRFSFTPFLPLSLSLSLSLSFSLARFLSLCLCRPLISFRGNCVYGTTRELQDFVIPWNCPIVPSSSR
jgi:hypothetical protein